MRILIIIISVFFVCASCGVKNEPKYKAQNKYNKNITKI